MLELLVAGAMLVAVLLFALAGGADFGGGIWTLFAFLIWAILVLTGYSLRDRR